MESRDRFSGEVKEVAFRSQRHLPVTCRKEKVDETCMVERGYIPPQAQIADMMAAGKRLADARRARFDSDYYKDGEEPGLDPMREPGLDLVDVQNAAKAANKALEALQQKQAAKIKEAEDAAKKAELSKAVEEELARREKEVVK